MVEGGGGEDCMKAMGLHAKTCACLATDDYKKQDPDLFDFE